MKTKEILKLYFKRFRILLRGKRFYVRERYFIVFPDHPCRLYTLVDRWEKRVIFPESDLPAVYAGACNELNELHWDGEDNPIEMLRDEYWFRAGVKRN